MARREASFMVMCWVASRASGPVMRISPMWLTSKMPTRVRTARCSAMRPPVAGYSTGMSQPLNSTILAPMPRCTAFKAVLRMAGVVARLEDKGGIPRCADWEQMELVTVSRRFYMGQTMKTAEDAKDAEDL